MENRSFSVSGKYRYGFNGQEQDAELGDYYSFKFRIHDARLGRFLSIDPLFDEYPWNSVYAFAENRVIDGKDLEGREWSYSTTTNNEGVTHISITLDIVVANSAKNFNIRRQNKLVKEIQKQFAKTFSMCDEYDESGKLIKKYTSSINLTFKNSADIDANKQLYVDLKDDKSKSKQKDDKSHSKQKVAGGVYDNLTSQKGGSSAFASYRSKIFGFKRKYSIKSIAHTILHENGHGGGLGHPTQPPSASTRTGIEQVPNDAFVDNGKPPLNADIQPIIRNIMIYSSTKVDGKRIYEYVKDISDRNLVTKGQAEIIIKTIDYDRKQISSN